jgi:NAD(P)H dehydrogenase (quinone)
LRVLVVFDHPRRDSFSGAVLDRFLAGLVEAGHVAELADLQREDFDPRMPMEDEPDWNDDNKVYSERVLTEQARMLRNDALAFVFPVWWWSFPAMTKGWIDRVWNNGWAYGSRKLPHKKAVLLGVCSGSESGFAKRGYDTAIRTQLLTGTMAYCGIEDCVLHLLHDVTDSAEARARHLEAAYSLGKAYAA